jgi:polysaccharide export outer membrane protein
MPVGNRGHRLAGFVALLTLAVVGPGCQTGGMMCTQCANAPRPPGGLINQFQSMTASVRSSWNGSPSSPSAPVATSAWTNVDRLRPDASQGGFQPTGGRYPGEPALATQIPVTTTGAPPPAFGGSQYPTTTQMMPLPVAATSPPAGTVATTRPVSYVPGPNPLTSAAMNIKAKINDFHTADAIKYAPPVPHGVPREFEKRSLPPYIIEPPDVLLVESTAALKDQQPIRGQHLVRPDGTISLGVYGEVYVAGLTIAQAKEAVVATLSARLKEVSALNTNLDVIAYNSKKYYIITDGGGYGEQIYPFPITGNETVLDALSNIYGLPAVASKKNIWIARATPDGSPYPKILPVDWRGISQYGAAATNYQILPGDRIYVKADSWITGDTWLARRLAPLERILGTSLLFGGAVTSDRGAFR